MQSSPPSQRSQADTGRTRRQSLVKISPDTTPSDIDLVVRTTKQLRQRLLDDLGAHGLSFHECLDSLIGRLPDEDMRRLRFIATVRNKILTEVGTDTLDSRAGFVQAVEKADAGITLLADAWRAQAALSARSASENILGDGITQIGSRLKAGCFIATVVYSDPDAPQLSTLREYRDNSLMNSLLGRALVYFYYLASPPIAAWLIHQPRCAGLVRRALNVVVRRLDRG